MERPSDAGVPISQEARIISSLAAHVLKINSSEALVSSSVPAALGGSSAFPALPFPQTTRGPQLLVRQTLLSTEILASQRTTPTPDDKHSSTASSSEEAKTTASSSSSDNCRPLYVHQDEANLSPYQCLLRQQIEIFEATEADLNDKSQGRNRPIVVTQIGIRCRHCGRKPTRERAKGAVFFPSRLVSLYQTGQNMASKHFIHGCLEMPRSIREDLIRVQVREKGKKGTKTRKSAYGGGRNYWADCLRLLGVVETDDRRLCFSPSQGADDGKCTTSDP